MALNGCIAGSTSHPFIPAPLHLVIAGHQRSGRTFDINRFALLYVRYYARRPSFAERFLLILAEPDLVRCSAENEVGKQNYNRQSDNQHDVKWKLNPGAPPCD
jgi:hypothetical protein